MSKKRRYRRDATDRLKDVIRVVDTKFDSRMTLRDTSRLAIEEIVGDRVRNLSERHNNYDERKHCVCVVLNFGLQSLLRLTLVEKYKVLLYYAVKLLITLTIKYVHF